MVDFSLRRMGNTCCPAVRTREPLSMCDISESNGLFCGKYEKVLIIIVLCVVYMRVVDTPGVTVEMINI